LQQHTARFEGIGEVITPLSLPKLYVVLINPRIHIDTSNLFRQGISPSATPLKLDVLHTALSSTSTLLAFLQQQHNSLQPYAEHHAPILQHIIQLLLSQPECQLARMSGSGSTCFGLFTSEQAAKQAATQLRALHPQWWILASALH
jgi:4-diphosphocytidyl-2-C-methyl-D-erythritol kinase